MSRLLLAASAAVVACAAASPSAAQGQQPSPLDVVVTPNRSPTDIQRTGSAITVISGEEVRRTNPATLLDVLRQAPGVSATSNGGPGGTAFVAIRGAETRHTLVLIDGIRVGDTTSTGGEFNFANLVATDIERIEILRGPQSALYGSDAIGGVINIITRKGRGAPTASVQIEGGSYGTGSVIASASGGTRDFNYAFALSGLSTQGFSAYGYRIAGLQGFGPLDRDGNRRIAGTARFGWRPSDALEIEGGIYAGRQQGGYDAAFSGFGYRPDTPSQQEGRLATAYLRAKLSTLDGLLDHQVTLSGSRTERILNDVQRYTSGGRLTEERNRYGFTGDRTGLEYQGTLNLGAWGRTIFGAGFEREEARFDTTPIANSFQRPAADSYGRNAASLFVLTRSRSPTGSTSRSAAASTRSRTSGPSRRAASRPHTASPRPARSCAPASAPAPRPPRSTSNSRSTARRGAARRRSIPNIRSVATSVSTSRSSPAAWCSPRRCSPTASAT